MKIVRVVAMATLAAAVLAGSARAQGAKPGQPLPGPFRVFVVTGEVPPPSSEGLLPSERQNAGDRGRVGKFHDFVTRFGLDPAVAVFVHGEPPAADQPLGKLFAALEQTVDRNKAARLHAWGVFLGLKDEFLKDEGQSEIVKKIEAFAQSLKLKHIPLGLDLSPTVDSNERARRYGIAPETSVIVLVYSNHTIRGRWDFTPDKPLDDAGIAAIIAEVKKVIGAKK